jgi:hypothetical protein
MNTINQLADYKHPLVRAKAEELTAGETTIRGKLEKLFFYVRDEIKFGFPPDGDLVKASDTIKMGYGQCNTKGTLFLALSKALNIPARMHFSLIKKEIQRGLFTGLIYKMMPEYISHSWVDVEVDGKWRRLDAYINDLSFYFGGRQKLKERGWKTGFSVSCAKNASSTDFDLDQEKFVQMDAVVEDQGAWDDPAEYYATDLYKNRPNTLKLFVYRLVISQVNRRVTQTRGYCDTGLCGNPEPA